MIAIPKLLAISDAEQRAHGLEGRLVDCLEDWLEQLAEAGVDAVQIREKHLDDVDLLELARRVRRSWSGTLLINGRVDIALAAGAEGVHLPAAELPIAPLRRRFGQRILLGRSTHSPEEVGQARRAGADYVTFGPVFPTPSKARYGEPPGLTGLRRATAEGLPVIALGGIGPDELAAVAEAGAVGVAGIRAFHEAKILQRWAGARHEAWPEENLGIMEGSESWPSSE